MTHKLQKLVEFAIERGIQIAEDSNGVVVEYTLKDLEVWANHILESQDVTGVVDG
jgi:hypothetical protein